MSEAIIILLIFSMVVALAGIALSVLALRQVKMDRQSTGSNDATLLHQLEHHQADLQQRMAEDLSDLKIQMIEKIGQSSDAVGQRVQTSLQNGRVEQNNTLSSTVQTLERKFNQLRDEVERKLTHTVAANRTDLAEVSKRLVELGNATGQIVALSKGVNELHTLMKGPTLRGLYGEWTLERLLAEVLGNEGVVYKRQLTINGGERVDIGVYLTPSRDQVVCIDAKFPATQAQRLLQEQLPEADRLVCERQFAKDVLTQARQIAKKYICPPQTADFAFMFVPTESVFQLLLSLPALHEKLLQLNVIPTSPNSLYAYLQSLAFALRGQRIEQSAKDIQTQVGHIAREFQRFLNDYRTLGTHLSNAKGKYEDTFQDIQRFTRSMDALQALGTQQPADNPAGDVV